mgnify:CR=1 FL=1
MSFTTIKEEIKIFGKRKYQLMKDYVELDEEMKKKFEEVGATVELK